MISTTNILLLALIIDLTVIIFQLSSLISIKSGLVRNKDRRKCFFYLTGICYKHAVRPRPCNSCKDYKEKDNNF